MSSEPTASDLRRRARIALDTCRAVHAPDARTTRFDLEVRAVDGGERFALTGAVETERLLGRARASVRDATGRAVVAREVTVLEGHADTSTVAESGVRVGARPAGDAERVTELLAGDAVRTYERRGRWAGIRAPDGYLGWVDADRFVEATPIKPNAVVTRPVEGAEAVTPGVECKVLETDDGESLVEFRTGDRTRLPEDALARRGTASTPGALADCARSFVGTPVRRGGKTTDGIDAGGLAWVAARAAGVPLPRDPDQQRRVGAEVGPREPAQGDLLFAPGHVAVSLGGGEYVHACPEADEVVEESFDPADGVGGRFSTARRLVER